MITQTLTPELTQAHWSIATPLTKSRKRRQARKATYSLVNIVTWLTVALISGSLGIWLLSLVARLF